jgi:hypothetical protein
MSSFFTPRIGRCLLATVGLACAAATSFGQLTLQGSIPIGDPANATNPPGNPGDEPLAVAITNVGGQPRAWVADYGNPGVGVLDLSVVPATRLAFIPAPAGSAHALDLDAVGNRVAVTYTDANYGSHVAVYDATTLAQLAYIVVGAPGSFSQPEGVALLDNVSLVVTDRSTNTVQLWPYAPLGPPSILSTLLSPTPAAGPGDVKLAVLGARRFVVVAERDSDSVEAFRVTPALTLAYTRARFATDPRPSHLFFEPATPMLLVSSPEGNSVTVFPGGRRLTMSMNGPRGISVSTDTSGVLHVYVANLNRGQIAYYSGPIGTTPSFVSVVNVSRAPYAIASLFPLLVGAPPNPTIIGDRIVSTSLADDSLDDVGR